MSALASFRTWCAGLLVLVPFGVARGDEPAASARPAAEEPGISLLDAARSGAVAIEAEGTGDGRMSIRVTNQTGRRLKVVLPPGLIASGATGQFGGMGGMGMGGRGMGGGMGGMGGGMGGMGGGMGGMGGMGGGMGGRGGMMGGGMGGGQMLTMPATMGLMMVGRLIMTLVEPTESWNPRSLMMGMMMMGGGMGMGGGMMGGMGGGMMGGMGGMGGMGMGMRSVPPTDLPNATLAPGQVRDLSTRIVSLNGPDEEGNVSFPAKGEALQIGDVAQTEANPKVQEALRRLARDKAPENVAQLAIWAAGGMAWSDIARISRDWANAHEIALARQFVSDLDSKSGDTGRLLIEVSAKDEAQKTLAGELSGLFRDRTVLGLAVEDRVPTRPNGPAVACKVQLSGNATKSEAVVSVAVSDAMGSSWTPSGKFTLPVVRDEAGKVKWELFGDSLAEGLLNRLVKVSVKKTMAASGGLIPQGPRAKDLYTIRVENYSPLMLNGVAILGANAKEGDPAKMLLGVAISPRRSYSMPATGESVERLGLKQGIKVIGLDLSGL